MAQTFVISLGGTADLEYKLPNEIDPSTGRQKPHRGTVTGTDREGKAKLLSVIGIMPKVVHEKVSGTKEPHSLVIFEWSLSPEARGARFRSVIIEVAFSAIGPRGEAEADAAELRRQNFKENFWDPEVARMVPSGTEMYTTTHRKISGRDVFELGLSVSFNQYLSVGPKWTMERDVNKNRTDAVKVIGSPATVGPSRNRPNGVRWTLTENTFLRSGVPTYMRTAVLLKRQPKDDGLFIGTIKIETHVSKWQDLMEKKYKLDGSVKKDEPIIFDPTLVDVTTELGDYNLDDEFQILTLEAPPDGPVGSNTIFESAN